MGRGTVIYYNDPVSTDRTLLGIQECFYFLIIDQSLYIHSLYGTKTVNIHNNRLVFGMDPTISIDYIDSTHVRLIHRDMFIILYGDNEVHHTVSRTLGTVFHIRPSACVDYTVPTCCMKQLLCRFM